VHPYSPQKLTSDYAHARPKWPEIDVKNARKLVLLAHGGHSDLDMAVFRKEGHGLTHHFEVTPEERVRWFRLGRLASLTIGC